MHREPLIVLALIGGVFASSCKSELMNVRSGKRGSGDETPAPCLRIRGGEAIDADSKDGELYRSSGQILVPNNKNVFVGSCSGNLVAPNIVLTARHCVEPYSADAYPTTLKTLVDPSTRKFDLQDGSGQKKVKKIIGWENRDRFRDVALMVLESPYPETVPVYRVAVDRLYLPMNSTLADSPLLMVGSGGYADGNKSSSYSYGTKRKGKAIYEGYELTDHFSKKTTKLSTACVAADDPNCLEYLSFSAYMTSGGEAVPDPSKPMICSGDSGSSLFWKASHSNLIVGVTSLGVSKKRDTKENDCNTSMFGLYVPSHAIAEWVNDKIAEENNADLPVATNLMTGKITKIDAKTGFSAITIDSVRFIDDSLGLIPADLTNDKMERSVDGLRVPSLYPTFSFDVCTTACPATTLATTLEVGKEIKFRFGQAVDVIPPRSIATFITTKDASYRYTVEFIGKVAEDLPEKTTRMGREEVTVKLKDVRTISGELPSINETNIAIVCVGGACSKVTELNIPNGLLIPGQEWRFTGEFIEDQGFYLRKVESVDSSSTAFPCE